MDMEIMTREANSYLWEIEEGYRDDADTMKMNNFWISIASIRRMTPTIPVDHMPGDDHDTADGEDHGQKKTTIPMDHKSWEHHDTACKEYLGLKKTTDKEDSAVRAQHYIIGKPSTKLKTQILPYPIPGQPRAWTKSLTKMKTPRDLTREKRLLTTTSPGKAMDVTTL